MCIFLAVSPTLGAMPANPQNLRFVSHYLWKVAVGHI
uniref:Uncharacterized protein n=1 Tax=Pseudomonas putida (strain ATCC 700007 / DSM 6899 / JCM 31910 / BCRC 17059 / LMG 24140 / F1) TaxID=351746 RepID=A5VY37_PSEP1